MSEGGIFIATWERISNGYRVWVRDDRTLAAEGTTFPEADERLWRAIGMATDDGENLREYSPPPPHDSGTPSGVPHLWNLGIEPRTFMLNAEVLFEGGLCPVCLMPRGLRTSTSLGVESIDDDVDVSRVNLPRRSVGAGPTLSVFSGRFLALLSPPERALFTWRAVDTVSGDRAFYEFIPAVIAPYVTSRKRAARFRICGECGWKWSLPGAVPGLPFLSVSAADVPEERPDLIAVGNFGNAHLAATESRWAEFVGREGTRGIKGTVLAVIPEADVERSPEYQLRTPEPPIKEKTKG